MAFPQFATQTETETAAFGYRAGVLVFEQRVRRNLWLSATCAVPWRRATVSQTKSSGRISFPIWLMDVQLFLGNRRLGAFMPTETFK